MKEAEPTRQQLLEEIKQLRQKNAELENQHPGIKRAGEMASQSFHNLEKILESAPDVIFQLSPTGYIQYVSPRVKEIYGYRVEELVGEHLKKTTPLSEVPKALKAITAVLAGKTVNNFEILQIDKQGQTIPCEINAVPIRESGRVVAIQGILHNISEHKKTEQALRQARDQLDLRVKERTAQLNEINKRLEQDIEERRKTEEQLRASEENFRTIFENARDIIISVNPRGTIININRRVEDILGYLPQDLLNKNIAKLGFLKIRDLPKILSVFAEVVKTAKPSALQIMELSLRHKDGHSVMVEVSTEHIMKAGRIAGFLSVIRDISERKQEEEALIQSQERFKTIYEYAPDAYYLNDLKGNFIDGNRAAEELTGYQKEELIGKSFLKLKLLPAGQLPRAAKLLALNALGKPTGPDEFTLNRKDGTQVPVEITTHPIQIHGISLVLGIARDITVRKEAQKQLEESEERYRTMIESAPDGIITLDLKGVVTSCNPAYLKISGYGKKEIVGKHFSKIPSLASQNLTPYGSLFERSIQERIPVPLEIEFTNKDGTRRISEVHLALLKEKGTVTGLQAIIRDVSERKRAERLLEALNRTAGIMQEVRTPDEIFRIITTELNNLGFNCALFPVSEDNRSLIPRYIGYNAKLIKKLETVTGLKAADFRIPVDTVGIFHQIIVERKTVYVESVEKIIRQIFPGPLSTVAGKIAGILKVTQAIVAPLSVEDKVIGILEVESGDLTQDDCPAITAFAHQVATAWHTSQIMQQLEKSLADLQSTQAQLIHAQKMEAVGTLAGGVAHDFNNLLTAIIGYSDLLLIQYHDHKSLYDKVNEIKKAADRAASLTRQLLAFSRRQPLRKQLLDINLTVANMEKMLNRLIGENIRLVTRLGTGVKPVNADPGQIEQVIMNLVVNARDALPQGGHIIIETSTVTVEEAQARLGADARPGRFVCTSIADNGLGIKPEILERIFEPFFTTKDVGKGTGLGLSVIYGIVSQHQGWIDVKSEEGKGSTFFIYLPVYSRSPADRSGWETSVPDLQGQNRRVLLVEDETEVRHFTKTALEAKGFVVFEAISATEGLFVYEKEKGAFDLVLSDVVLPDRDGLQLVNQLLMKNADLKVLLCSGYADQRAQWQQIRERGLPFLQKPYNVSDLYKAVARALKE